MHEATPPPIIPPLHPSPSSPIAETQSKFNFTHN